MIRSFRSKALKRFAETDDRRGLSVQKHDRIRLILNSLEAATRPEDVNLPSLRFHRLVGDRKGAYAVSVSGNWRITFRWDGDDVVDVDLEDYH
ncbi:MAG TPA: type II toxin-antitoxin system RelE/ParE family toxin [Afifellaceae bacterium]|nr:type II toxin-antitoxin system RelE/ParE family toxin [Afifellaceae bacterium]